MATPSSTASTPVNPAPAPSLDEEGIVHTPPKLPGHRVYVDGKLANGQSPVTLKLACGIHTLKIGSQGKERVVDVPCGGEVTLEP
jgi:hypothetical protein